MTEPTGLERLSLETMPKPPRHSRSQSGARSIDIGAHTTDASEADESSDDEDEAVYIKTQKICTLEYDSDTSDGFPTRLTSTGQRKPVKPPNLHGTQDDAEGFTPVRMRQDQRQMRSQTRSTPTSDGKLPAVPQIRAKLTTTVPSAHASQSPPAEIQLDYSNMDEALYLPVQLDTLTEILQERLLAMTNQINRREQQQTDKLQQTEARLHKSERKTAAERQSHRQYIDKTIKRLED